jgi:hypothetical protein
MSKMIVYFVVFCILALSAFSMRQSIIEYQIATSGDDVTVSVVPGNIVCGTKRSYAKVRYKGKQYDLKVFSYMCYQIQSGELKTIECKYSSKYDKLRLVSGTEFTVIIMMTIMCGGLTFFFVKEYVLPKR